MSNEHRHGPERRAVQTIAAALDCAGGRIFLEDDEFHESRDTDIVDTPSSAVERPLTAQLRSLDAD
ncbi:MAG: hypothetical protein ACKVWR_17955 [Acidimicrobiales bacterium]